MNNKEKAHRKWLEIKRRSFEKSREFTLSEEWIYDRLENGKCEVTGLPFSSKGHWATGSSIDRTDNSKGYTEENCRMIYYCLNIGKRDLPEHIWYLICKKFVKWYEDQNPKII